MRISQIRHFTDALWTQPTPNICPTPLRVTNFCNRCSRLAPAITPDATEVTMRLLILILLVLLVAGALPTWPYSANWGYYPSGGLGTILIVLLVLLLLGVI
tara:strand:+ start:442 stop:744 length:303 start_codon:yes stop_codon:yes gene_type:complete